jgi:hypothetical protein
LLKFVFRDFVDLYIIALQRNFNTIEMLLPREPTAVLRNSPAHEVRPNSKTDVCPEFESWPIAFPSNSFISHDFSLSPWGRTQQRSEVFASYLIKHSCELIAGTAPSPYVLQAERPEFRALKILVRDGVSPRI